jgi:HEPN domain-containing protein
MPGVEGAVLVAMEWVAKAEEDLKTAAHTLKLGRSCPTGPVCFYAQQAVEKYLKACLVSQELEFSKTHDIEEFVWRMPENLRPKFRTPDVESVKVLISLTWLGCCVIICAS